MLTRTSKGESLLLLALEVLSLGMELGLRLRVSKHILEVRICGTNQFSLLLFNLQRGVNKQTRMIRARGTYLFPAVLLFERRTVIGPSSVIFA